MACSGLGAGLLARAPGVATRPPRVALVDDPHGYVGTDRAITGQFGMERRADRPRGTGIAIPESSHGGEDMSLRHQLQEAAERLDIASARVAELRAQGAVPEAAREWLEALSDMVLALSDLQTLGHESVQEKLHAIAARLDKVQGSQ